MSHTEEEITRETEGTEEPCCVVGIGASAGGLEALQDFFKAMPADTGAAFEMCIRDSDISGALDDQRLTQK